MSPAPAMRPPPKPPVQGSLLQPPPPTSRKTVAFGGVGKPAGHRTVLYGPGGIGKTTLACYAPGSVAFIDLDDSLPILQERLPNFGELKVVSGIVTWADLRAALQSDGWDGIKSIVIDTGTKAEELCVAHTLETVPVSDRNATRKAQHVEDYGYGKGYGHVFDTFLPILGDLDRHCRAGRHVIINCHDCTTMVPNPSGEDWMRYEPRLQSPSSGKASIRLRVREWADHVLFVGYDVAVGKDRKGQGSGTRTIYPCELPHCMAKSRTIGTPLAVGGVEDGAAIWEQIIK